MLSLTQFSNTHQFETAGKELTSWLSFVVSNCECEFVTFPLVSWVSCGT